MRLLTNLLKTFSNCRQVGQNLVVPGGARSFDVRGQFVIPAGIDTSTQAVLKEHAETKTGAIFSLTRSAICGGTTLVFIELRRGHPSESLLFAFQRMLGVFSKESCCNFAVNVVVDHFDDPTARDLETLARDHGVASFQVDIASLPDEQLLQIVSCSSRSYYKRVFLHFSALFFLHSAFSESQIFCW